MMWTYEELTAVLVEAPGHEAARVVRIDDGDDGNQDYQVFMCCHDASTTPRTMRLRRSTAPLQALVKGCDEKHWRTIAYALGRAETHGTPLLAMHAVEAATHLAAALSRWVFTPEVLQQLVADKSLSFVAQTVRTCLVPVTETCWYFGNGASEFVRTWSLYCHT